VALHTLFPTILSRVCLAGELGLAQPLLPHSQQRFVFSGGECGLVHSLPHHFIISLGHVLSSKEESVASRTLCRTILSRVLSLEEKSVASRNLFCTILSRVLSLEEESVASCTLCSTIFFSLSAMFCLQMRRAWPRALSAAPFLVVFCL
jgi:hypothetical protein